MPRSKCNITVSPGLGVRFASSDKDGDGFRFRKLEGRDDASVECHDATGNAIIAELPPHTLRLFVDFINEHVAPTLPRGEG